MPTYDYRCKACDHEFEEFQAMSAKTLRKCPSCSKMKLERLIGTGAAILFKGSGFYQTDYRSESYKKAAKADSDSGKPKSDGEDSKTGASKSGGDSKSDSGSASAGKSESSKTAKPKSDSKPPKDK